MAAFTSTAGGGNWSAAGTWTTTPPSGGPGSGDTVTLLGSVTIDSAAGAAGNGYVTVGSSPATGGTAAIAWGTSTSGVTLTLAAGTTLTLQGDLAMSCSSLATALVVMGAGCSVILKPPSGQQYLLKCTDPGTNCLGMWTINGTVAARCTVKTDKSLGGTAGYFSTDQGKFATQGVVTATHCDFYDLGTASAFGVQTQANWPATSPYSVSITGCTFTRSSYSATYNSQDPPYFWDANSTFSNNTFSSSVVASGGGFNSCFFLAGNDIAASSGTRTVSGNRFDTVVVLQQTASWHYQYNIFLGVQPPWIVTGTWTKAWASFDSNLGYYTTINAVPAALAGDCTNSFFMVDAPTGSNNHIAGLQLISGVATFNTTGNILECNNNQVRTGTITTSSSSSAVTGVGTHFTTELAATNVLATATGGVVIGTVSSIADDTHLTLTGSASGTYSGVAYEIAQTFGHWLFTPSSPAGATTWNVKYNITLPKSDGTTPATLIVTLGNVSNLTIVAEHNTGCVEGDALVWAGHLQTTAGQPTWSSASANLAWGADTVSEGYVVTNPDNTTLADIVPASAIKNNGRFHINTAASGMSGSGNGYNLTLTSAAGGSDVTADPQFVDKTRNIMTWGVTQGLSAPTEAQALAYLQDPTNGPLSTLIPSLLAHVRAGFRPQNVAYRAASYAGDASTADAAGNAWPGGSPGIGAMAVAGGAGTGIPDIFDGGLLR